MRSSCTAFNLGVGGAHPELRALTATVSEADYCNTKCCYCEQSELLASAA